MAEASPGRPTAPLLEGVRPSPRQGVGMAGAALLLLAAVGLNEGGFVDDPADPGGATNHGVTERVARKAGYAGRMQDLPLARANEILWQGYAVEPGIDAIVRRNIALGEEVFDASVNMGPPRPSRYFQVALNALNDGGRLYPDIAEDGRLGPATMAAYDALARRRGTTAACEAMMKLVDAQQAVEYIRLGKANKTLERFAWGWVRTRIGNVPLARCAEGGVSG